MLKIVFSLILLSVVGLAQDLPPQIYTLPQVRVISTGKFIAGKFTDIQGNIVNLPSTGRYLLWLVDSAFIFEDREAVPLNEFEPGGSETLLYNPTVLTLPAFADLPNSYLVFHDYYSDFPLGDEWSDAAARFSGMQVLFNNKLGIEGKVILDGMGFESPLDDLLFMEGQKVAYVYPNAWTTEGFTELIKQSAESFLAGGEPLFTRSSIGTTWEELAGQPTLVFSTSEDVLDASADGVRVEEVVNPDGSLSRGTVSDHPGDASRFLLEKLTGLLEAFNVRGVALLREQPMRLEALEQTFPAWDFLYLQTPEDLLRWSGIPAAILDEKGTIQSILLIAVAEEETITSLEKALKKVSSQ